MPEVLSHGGEADALGGEVVQADPAQPCCCGPAGCLWYRYARCGNPTCPTDAPLELWLCMASPPQSGETRISSNLHCYRWDGAAGLTDQPAGVGLLDGHLISGCDDPSCNADLCPDFFGMRPCSGEVGCGGLVVMTRAQVQAGDVVGVVTCPGETIGRCYCLDGTTYRELPPGATIATTPLAAFNTCCKCRFNFDRARGVAIPPCSWGNDVRGLDVNGCCCGRITDVEFTLTGFGPFGRAVELANRRDCRPSAPNGFQCTFDFLEAGAIVGTMAIGAYCGSNGSGVGNQGAVRLLVVPGFVVPPTYISSLFGPGSNDPAARTCTTWASSPSFSYAVATVNILTDTSQCGCGMGVSGAFSGRGSGGGCGGCGGLIEGEEDA